LSIPCEKLTDANVRILAENTSLEIVHLRARRPVHGTNSLLALSKLPRLRELVIGCTDDIRDADIMAFAEIKSFETLSVFTNAPLTCQDRLRQRRPDCEFIFQKPTDKIQ
jgi:hypothetical protein